MMAIDLHVTGSKGPPINAIVEITDSFDQLALEIYAYYLVIMLMVSVLLAVGSIGLSAILWNNLNQQTIKRLMTKTLRASWQILETTIDQENYQPSTNSERTLWFTTCSAIFITVFGAFLSLVHTDMVQQVSPAIIEFPSDLLSGQFDNVKMTLPTSDWYYDYMRNARNGTISKQIYEKYMHTDCSSNNVWLCTYWKFRPSSLDGRLTDYLFQTYSDGSGGYIGSRIISVEFKRFLCLVSPKLLKRIYETQPWASEILSWFYSKTVDRQLERLVSDYETFLAESYLLLHEMEAITPYLLIEELGLPSHDTGTFYQCFHDEWEKEHENVDAIGLPALRKLLLFVVYSMIVAGFILLIEVISRGRRRSNQVVPVANVNKWADVRARKMSMIALVNRQVKTKRRKSRLEKNNTRQISNKQKSTVDPKSNSNKAEVSRHNVSVVANGLNSHMQTITSLVLKRHSIQMKH